MKPIPTQGLSLDSIQAMRAIAALSVVLAHVRFIGVGVFGVDIFFVISGFIVAYVTADGADGFLRKRIARIVPLYWAGTLGIFVLSIVASGLLRSTHPDAWQLLLSLFFVPFAKANGEVYPLLFLGWTLNYEMFFYLLFALALRIDRARAPLLAIAAILALVALGQAVAFTAVIPRFYTAPLLLEFAYGLAAFLCWQRFRPLFARVPAALAAAGALLALLAMVSVDSATVTSDNRWLTLGLPALAFFALVLSLQGKWRMPAFLVLAGDASYSLYLFHPYVIQLVDRKVIALDTLTVASGFGATAAVLGSLLFAVLCFRHFERPANQWLRRKLLA